MAHEVYDSMTAKRYVVQDNPAVNVITNQIDINANQRVQVPVDLDIHDVNAINTFPPDS